MKFDLHLGLVEEVEVRLIKPSPRPVRDDMGSISELKASISEKGLLQPILVRPTDVGFELVAGSRRLQACKSLGLRKILCHIMELNEKEAYEAALTENLQHRTLNPVEEALALKKYVSDYGYGGESELARRIGKSEQYVSQRIRLLSLPEDVLLKVSRRLVNLSQAVELIGLEKSEQRIISDIVVRDRVSSRSVRRIARDMKNGQDVSLSLDFQPNSHTNENNRVQRVLDKCIVLLRTNLIRFNDAISHLREDDWIAKEMLQADSRVFREQIDVLIRVRSKLGREEYLKAL